MKSKVEFIKNKESNKECYICNGTGTIFQHEELLEESFEVNCNTCQGTGIFVDNQYIMVATDDKGNKIAFNVDGIK